MEFATERNGSTPPVYYVIWCWKADYWNLGAGAEIGIYYTEEESNAEANFYEIDPQLTVHTRMKIDYTWLNRVPVTLNDFHQTNWWVTSFTPSVQLPNIEWLNVNLDVRFTGDNYYPLMRAFVEAYNSATDEGDNSEHTDWIYVQLLDPVAKSRPAGHSSHICGNRPESCTCACPSGNAACSWPCKYYPLRCTENCTHIDEPENGFQFKITY